jgi:hypothetical protein
VLLFILALPAFLLVGAFGYLEMWQIIFPRVQVGDVRLEGLAIHEAAAKLDQVWNIGYRIMAVDTMDPGRSWIVMPSEFGLQIDDQASAMAAYEVGRNNNLLDGVEQMISGEWRADPIVSFDAEIARRALQAWAEVVYVPALEGQLAIVDGEVVHRPGKPGKRLDIGASLALLESDPAAVMLKYRFVPLVMLPVEPAIADVSQAAEEVKRLLATKVELLAYDPVTDEWFDWTPSLDRISSWIQIQRGKDQFYVDFQEDLLQEYVFGLKEGLGEERYFDEDQVFKDALAAFEGDPFEPVLLRYHPREYVVQQPETFISLGFKLGIPYWKLQEVNPQVIGRNPYIGETLTLPPRDALLTLPVVLGKRIVISISEQHMWIYQEGEVIRDDVISTGMAGSPTMAGIFQVQSHFINAYASRWDLWMPHFLGIYEAAPGFLNGIHGLPLLSNGVRLWGGVLGQPASYGCIVLNLEAAEWLFEWAEDGVVVEITA